ncbi:hypothetical protein N0V85_003679 [Neurospora sp. IMI 360204]|nr:hypothetical protein N0V85_003679 [Neurospora sp. IMI 360204]
MSTHTAPLLDRKVLLALVPLASLAASHPHQGNPNAHGPVNFSEIAQSIAAATIHVSTQPSSAVGSSHSTHLTPSLLHGILPNMTTSTSTSIPTSTSTDTDPLVIIPVTGTITDLVNYDTYTIPASLPPLPAPSASTTTATSGAEQETRTQTVWATVFKQTQVVTVVKTLTPEHTSSKTSSQSWPKGECTGKGDVAVDGKCVPKTMVTSTTTTRGGTQSTSSSGSTSSSVSFMITSPTSTSTSTSTSTTSTSTDTDPLVIIPVTGTVTDLINYDTYTIPTSLPPIPPPPRASASSSRSATKSSTSASDDDPLEIIPVTGTVTDLVDYDTVTLPSATATTVVVIPVSSSSSSTKSQNMGQMQGHIQGVTGL